VLDLEDSQRISAGFAKFGGVEATIGRAAGDCAVTFLESVFRGDASPSCKTSTSNVQVVVTRRPSSGEAANPL
jgi:hypothetical protein